MGKRFIFKGNLCFPFWKVIDLFLITFYNIPTHTDESRLQEQKMVFCITWQVKALILWKKIQKQWLKNSFIFK